MNKTKKARVPLEVIERRKALAKELQISVPKAFALFDEVTATIIKKNKKKKGKRGQMFDIQIELK